jgi:hypothetical protein
MALNASGPIILGGSTVGQSINLELGLSATAQISLDDAVVRTLAGVPSGTIIMPTNFWGKSSGYSLVVGTRAPTLNASTGASPYPPTGWTSIQDGDVDDAAVSTTIPTFYFNGTAYTTAYIGSNTYITFGGGSSNYSGLSSVTPALDKIMMQAADNSYQRVAYKTSANYTQIRYEGNSTTSGTIGSPGVVYEATFFNSAYTNGVPWVEILIGIFNRTGGISGIYTSGGTNLGTFNPIANQSYVLVGNNATGTSFTVYTGSYVNYS